jgi:ABC-type uncharacterized transport system fused permease/ATPase subunit
MRKDDLVYVPQRPYLTVGNLREQLTYPYRSSDPHVKMLALQRHGVTDEEWANGAGLDRKLSELLESVGLSSLLTRTYDDNGSLDGDTGPKSGWESTTTWDSVLSLGEQQRLGMARLFFRKPRLAILDEATNATSVDIEDRLYSIATGADTAVGMGITCITISQRPALVRFHQRELKLKDGKGDWELVRRASLRLASVLLITVLTEF